MKSYDGRNMSSDDIAQKVKLEVHKDVRDQVNSAADIFYPVEKYVEESSNSMTLKDVVDKIDQLFMNHIPTDDMKNIIGLFHDPLKQHKIYLEFIIVYTFMTNARYHSYMVRNCPSSYSIKHSIERWMRSDKHNKKYLHHITDTMVEIVALLLGKKMVPVEYRTFICLDKKRSPIYNIPIINF